jgi:DNA (cytosine-5)-methyltransferase 1
MKQLNIFELTRPKYIITKPIRLIELFAGIGSQAKALQNIGANFEHYRVIEFDEYAIASYNAIHDTNFAPLDITKITAKDLGIVETDKYDYIMTYSFPCQDLSTAGKRKGMKKGSGTRSGLLWEVEYLLSDLCGFKEHRVPPGNSKYLSIAEWVDDYNYDIDKSKLPQILLMENVPQVIGEKNLKDFREWQLFLEKLGYSSYFKLLNAKDYEIPQNRNRCFMVSILGDYYYEFPRKRKLKLRLKDMLEDEVDENYYLSDKMKAHLMDMTDRNGFVRGEKFKPHTLDSKYAYTITTNAGSKATDNFIILPEKTKKGYAVADIGDGVYINRPHQKRGCVQKGMIQTIKTSPNDVGVVVEDTRNLKEKLADDLIESGTVKGGEIINHSYTNSKKNPNSRLELEDFVETRDGIVPTLTTRPDTLGVVQQVRSLEFPKILDDRDKGWGIKISDVCPTQRANRSGLKCIEKDLRIRKLTPKECWRLMGFDDEDFEKARKVNSDAQLYKQAGNSIVVKVLERIFEEFI